MENVVASLDRKVVYLKLDDILPNRFQPRIKFDEQALNELSQSIKEHGVLSPITVRPLGNKYEIIAGERRYKASMIAGLTDIPALIVKMDDKESAEIALIENVQRKDLTPIEEAISYKKIFDMNIGISQETLAKKLGKSQSAIANKLRLLNLSDEVQEALLENKISERHARSLLKLKDKKAQNQLLNKIITERMTVRKTDEEIINMLNNNKDIEILDFEFDTDEIKTEKINDPLNRFESLYNLPKTPIIEDKEDEFIPNIPDVLSVENTPKMEEAVVEDVQKEELVLNDELNKEEQIEESSNVDPGFLDISKIEQEASDINDVSKKLSLEELLKMPTDSINNITEEEKNVVPELPKNRFFTMIEEEDKVSFEPQEENVISNEENSQNKDNENIDLNFDSKFIPQEQTIFDKIDDMNNLNMEEEKELPFDSEIFNNEINLVNESEIVEENKEIELKEENNTDSLEINTDFILPTSNIIEDEVDEDMETSLKNADNNVLEEVTPVPPMDYTPIYDLEDDEPQIDTNVERHLETSKYGAADLKTIINTIRKCAETIEKYGYAIDTEEFDFEDMYQVIFKVQKKQ